MNALTVDSVPLNALHQRQVALQFNAQGAERTLVGRGIYETDDTLGPVLRVMFDPRRDGEILLAENQWGGQILPGGALGCDYLIRLS